ncbi:MAG: flippase [Chloroflexi bacterium]|uniref:Flippase n=2 Tax=Candidatus Chlorohelix allophototropha TaxID=3003348 RepID=A0A8T7LY19_9CHLR|nr:flippase [Chloroflexota bacterium]WJW67747.1 flippase [Chloroflexota bacterium L227-S17]
MSIAYAIFVPRFLGPEGVGVLAIGWSISQIIMVLATLGNRMFLVKEVARNPERAHLLVGTAIVINVVLGALCWSSVVLVYSLFVTSSDLKTVLLLIAISSVLTISTGPIRAALQGMEKMQYSLYDSIFSNGLFTGMSILFAILGFGVVAIAAVGLITVIPSVLLNYWWFSRVSHITLKPGRETIKEVVKGGIGFFVMDITFQIYLYLDALMLSVMTSETVVGYYNVPTRLFGTLLFVPVIVGNAILPALCRMAQQDRDNQIQMTRNTLNFFIGISFPMAAGTTVLALPIINLLYSSAFEPSVPILIILGWCIIPTYLGIGVVQSLIAQDRQGVWAKVNVVSTIVNFVLNLGLITLTQNLWNNGAVGAGITLLISEIVTTGIGLKLLSKGTINRSFLLVLLRTLITTGVMVLVIWPLRELFFLLPIGVGVIVYGLVGIIVGLIPLSYMRMALSMPRQLFKRESPAQG